VPEAEPFGENVANPASRLIPPRFAGGWARQGGPDLSIAPNEVRIDGRSEPVVAVRTIDANGVAVVTQSVEADGTWAYGLRYFGLSDGDRQLTDLESSDIVWLRQDGAKGAR